jgi:hypothetical protein
MLSRLGMIAVKACLFVVFAGTFADSIRRIFTPRSRAACGRFG